MSARMRAAVRELLAAGDACDVESTKPRESRSSAPLVRYCTALADLREADATEADEWSADDAEST